MEKKTSYSHVGIMSLWLQRGKNQISYMRHSCTLRKEQQNSDAGCCWFWAISGRLCIFTYFSVRVRVCVFCSCCVSGDSHAGSLIENPFLRYSVVNKGKDRVFQRSKWPLVSANRGSLALPPLAAAELKPTAQSSHARMSEWKNLTHWKTYFFKLKCGHSSHVTRIKCWHFYVFANHR